MLENLNKITSRASEGAAAPWATQPYADLVKPVPYDQYWLLLSGLLQYWLNAVMPLDAVVKVN